MFKMVTRRTFCQITKFAWPDFDFQKIETETLAYIFNVHGTKVQQAGYKINHWSLAKYFKAAFHGNCQQIIEMVSQLLCKQTDL
jgi:hypothetical protein